MNQTDTTPLSTIHPQKVQYILKKWLSISKIEWENFFCDYIESGGDKKDASSHLPEHLVYLILKKFHFLCKAQWNINKVEIFFLKKKDVLYVVTTLYIQPPTIVYPWFKITLLFIITPSKCKWIGLITWTHRKTPVSAYLHQMTQYPIQWYLSNIE